MPNVQLELLCRVVLNLASRHELADLAHDPGEDRDAHQHDNYCRNHLIGGNCEEVTISDRRQNGQREVHHRDQSLTVLLLVHLKVTDERVVVSGMIMIKLRCQQVEYTSDAIDHE